jgi:hypothetical protein
VRQIEAWQNVYSNPNCARPMQEFRAHCSARERKS